MSVEILTPETLTWEHIRQWDGPTMRRHLGSSPEMRARIYEISAQQAQAQVQSQSQEAQPAEVPPTVEDVNVANAEQEALRLAAEQKAAEEEAARVAAENARVEAERKAAEEAAKPKKIVVDYQIKDEDGNPIGRPTHLEATTEDEMRLKMIEAHTQATRAFHRLKKQKVQSLKEVNQQQTPSSPAMSDVEMIAAIKDLKSDDPQKALEAHRKLVKIETDRATQEKERETAEFQRQQDVSRKFLTAHKNDFNNCQANVNLIKDYFQENQLAWTLDNLEIAFHALESELAPVEKQRPVEPTPPANPVPAVVPPAAPTVPPAAPVVPTPAAAPVVQPTPPAPATATPPANPAPAAPRPGVNGGLVPGQGSSRPVAKPTVDLAAEIRSWDGPTMRKMMSNPTKRAQIEKFLAERRAQQQK